MTGSGMRPLLPPCGEQGKQPTAKALMLAERDTHMSEERQQPSYMQQLDRWSEATIINPLEEFANVELDQHLVEHIKKAIRQKNLESFRNGQRIGPRPEGFSRIERADFSIRPQRGGQKAYVR
jgi:hypothetical protein